MISPVEQGRSFDAFMRVREMFKSKLTPPYETNAAIHRQRTLADSTIILMYHPAVESKDESFNASTYHICIYPVDTDEITTIQLTNNGLRQFKTRDLTQAPLNSDFRNQQEFTIESRDFAPDEVVEKFAQHAFEIAQWLEQMIRQDRYLPCPFPFSLPNKRE